MSYNSSKNISKVKDREPNIKDTEEEILFDHKLSNHKPLASNMYERQKANSEILNFVKILAFCISRKSSSWVSLFVCNDDLFCDWNIFNMFPENYSQVNDQKSHLTISILDIILWCIGYHKKNRKRKHTLILPVKGK